MAPRVLYLHGLRGTPDSRRYKLLVEAYDSDSIKAPNLNTKRILIIFTVLFTLFCLSLVGISIITFVYWVPLGGFLITVVMLFIAVLTYVLAGRGVTHYMVTNAAKIAEKTFWSFRPNVIVASSFGAVVAFTMNVPKVSLVLLAPAQDAYCRYLRIKELPTLVDYPYVIVIHGSNDEEISLDDSIRLVDSSAFVHCKLEVIEDTHALETLTAGDYREFIDEVYEKGRQQVIEMREELMNKPLRKSGPGALISTIDPSLFDIHSRDTSDSDSQSLQVPLVESSETQEKQASAASTDVPSNSGSVNFDDFSPYTAAL